jgi:dTDP-4-amino-4,6-dideoxygalactose transaminase
MNQRKRQNRVDRNAPVLPYSRQDIREEDIATVSDALRGDWLAGCGPLTRQFEDALCEFTGYDHAIVTTNGGTALHLAYLASFRPGQTIWTTPLTFVATASEAVHAKLKVRLSDIDQETYLLSRVGYNYVPVSYAGYPSVTAGVSDDCHYLYPNMAHDRPGVITSVVSLHATKTITSSEGGIVLTRSDDVAEHCRMMRNYGRIDGKSVCAGHNYRLPDVLCALGLSQLNRATTNLERRNEIAMTYYEHWQDDDRIKLPPYHDRHNWHLYPIRVKQRDRFRQLMATKRITCTVHYPLIHTLSIMANQPEISIDRDVDLRKQIEIASQLVSIPLFSSMTDEDVMDVIEAVDITLDELEKNE